MTTPHVSRTNDGGNANELTVQITPRIHPKALIKERRGRMSCQSEWCRFRSVEIEMGSIILIYPRYVNIPLVLYFGVLSGKNFKNINPSKL